MEDINWNIMGSSVCHQPRMKFIIPVGGISREEAEKQIRELMKSYKDRNDIRKNWIQKIFSK